MAGELIRTVRLAVRRAYRVRLGNDLLHAECRGGIGMHGQLVAALPPVVPDMD